MSENPTERKFTLTQTIKIYFRGCGVINKACPGYLPMTVSVAVINALKPLIALFFSARVLNELSGGRDVGLIAAYVAATVLSVFALTAVVALLNQKMSTAYTYNNIEYLYGNRYIEMDYPHIEDGRVNQMLADIRARANGNGLGLWRLIWMLPSLAGSAVTLAVSVALLAGMFKSAGEYTRVWITSPAASLILAALAVIAVVSPILIHKWQKKAIEMTERENPKANTLFWFYMQYKSVAQAAKDIRLYNQAPTVMDIFAKRLNNRMWVWFFRRIAAAGGVSGGINAMIGGAIYLFIGLRALYGMYPIGSIVQYVGAVTNLIGTLSSIADNVGGLMNNTVYTQYVLDYLDLGDPPSAGSEKPDADNIDIEFVDVSFHYPGTDAYALRNVSLRFTQGKRLAVVGMNGSGKTTMIKLLCRLYRPSEGVILLNGKDIQSYSHAEYARLFNVVFQDFKLFSLLLGENVATARDYDREKAAGVLATAGFGARLAALEKGLDTSLGKDCDKQGVAFSGGEQQKIAIARAIYRDSPFVIFDEPTAALDPISEYEVYTKLNEIVGTKTAVFISHRLSSCRFCDDIAVFHEGRLIQQGSHDQLLTDCSGKYHELWTAQAQYYKTETA